MKYAKMLGLLALAAAALTALIGASTASATEITCGTTHHTRCAVGQTIHAVSIGKAVLDAPFGNVECESTVQGPVGNAGGPEITASGNITSLIWTNCGGDTVDTLATGSLEIHTDTAKADGNGILTSTGARVTVVHAGFHCIYETNKTTLGTVTGSTNTKGHAILDISAEIPRVGGEGGFFCGGSAPWTGSYTVTTPKTLVVH